MIIYAWLFETLYITYTTHVQITRELAGKRNRDRWGKNYMRLCSDFFPTFRFLASFYLNNKKWVTQAGDGAGARKSLLYSRNLHMNEALVFNPITCHMFDAIRTNINISFEHAKRISEASGIGDCRFPWNFLYMYFTTTFSNFSACHS